ncbi:hypothetical protein FGE12_09740 [Aggregicoccus sp. 17bor-14]|uniref:DUF2007 domain-containing protein n=1 Tax=Myxococcaceae TaxID=31 RepID=UPI00129C606A|nr:MULTISPECIES: DUF2007 domain-containing protein [Myxococcaceae]MBF5042682.1 DUF2007 domain-containing protein [Simulacricoccus sp. 17bor-14]MRI88450.1 hypothetical protein [Aggregicoccus sp. 17bor-14]
MKYCVQCGSEYQDGATECADCRGRPLVDAQTMRATGRAIPGERDTRTFVRAGTAEDPLTAERYVEVLEAAGLSPFARARRAGSVDSLTTGVVMPWWELLVPEAELARAVELLREERARFEATADEASLAAEEEEREGERGLDAQAAAPL